MRTPARLRLLVLASTILLVAPVLPVSLASATDVTCPPGECNLVPLYVLKDYEEGEHALSSLSGDGMPADPATHVNGGFLAVTPELRFDLEIVKAGAFNVSLASDSSADWVEGIVSVRARTLNGQEYELARRAFVPENSSGFPAAPPQADPVFDRVEQIYDPIDELVGGPELTRAALAIVYTQICGSGTPSAWNSNLCRQLTGRWGPGGSLDLCGRGPTNDLLGRVAYSSWNSVNNLTTRGDLEYTFPGWRLTPQVGVGPTQVVNVHVLDAPNQPSTCRHIFDDLNRTADETGAAPTDALREVIGAADQATQPLIDLMNGTLPPPDDWRSFTLDANAPQGFPQDADSFILPVGVRLVFEVDLHGVAYTPALRRNTQITFELGRQDAPTYLAARTTEKFAFSNLAFDAESIGEGAHTGTLFDGYAMDSYRFTAAPGSSINITSNELARLYEPNGALAGSGGEIVAPASPGEWILRVGGDELSVPFDDYSFSLRFDEAEGDGGLIAEGAHHGQLGAGDDADTYSFWVDRAQRFNLSLTWESPTARFEMQFAPSGLWAIENTTTEGSLDSTARATRNGYKSVTIARVYGAGAYTLSLEQDARGNLSTKPLVGIDLPGEFYRLDGYLDGVDAGVDDGIDHITPYARSRVADNLSLGTRTASGTLVAIASQPTDGGSSLPVVVVDGEPFVQNGSAMAFGSDGMLRATGIGNISRFDVTGSEQRIALPNPISWPEKVVVGPDGRTFIFDQITDKPLPILEADFSAGAIHVLDGPFSGVREIDAEGGPIRVLNYAVIERYDPATGDAIVLAHTGNLRIHDLTIGGDRIYVSLWNVSGGRGLGSFPYDRAAFESHRPTFEPAPAADLLPTSFEDIVVGVSVDPAVGEEHIFRIGVSNVGGRTSARFATSVSMAGGSSNFVPSRQDVETLGVGESTILEFRWYSGTTIGDRELRVMVDSSRIQVERNESNNVADFAFAAVIAGTRAACHTAMPDGPMPINVFGASEYETLCRPVFG